jgi:hypothetical protein
VVSPEAPRDKELSLGQWTGRGKTGHDIWPMISTAVRVPVPPAMPGECVAIALCIHVQLLQVSAHSCPLLLGPVVV